MIKNTIVMIPQKIDVVFKHIVKAFTAMTLIM